MAKNAMMSIREQIQKERDALTKSMGVKTLSVKQGKFWHGNTESDKDEVAVVILAFAHNAAWWAEAWSPGQSAVPDCAATGLVNTVYVDDTRASPPVKLGYSELIPVGEDKQAASCGVCPLNEFGTGVGGKGKACNNTYMLAVLPVTAPDEDIHTVRISKAGLKAKNKYLANHGTKNRVSYEFATTLKAKPAGAGWTIEVLSDNLMDLDDENLEKFYGRIEEAKAMLVRKPTDEADETEDSANDAA